MSKWQQEFAEYLSAYREWMKNHHMTAKLHHKLISDNSQTSSKLATDPLNIHKNRFMDVLPGENTVVKLSNGNYINADMIDGRRLFEIPFRYIMTQAPMKHTMVDFWAMIWEYNIGFIVTLTAEVENGVSKCESYWPMLHASYRIGIFSIENIEENGTEGVNYRVLRIRCKNNMRYLRQYQYIKWPAGSVPLDASSLFEIILDLGKFKESVNSPLVVHCGGGSGRSGIFVTLHVALCHFQFERQFTLDEIMLTLRQCRPGVAQRLDFYEFSYEATIECIQGMIEIFFEKTEVPISRIPQKRPKSKKKSEKAQQILQPMLLNRKKPPLHPLSEIIDTNEKTASVDKIEPNTIVHSKMSSDGSSVLLKEHDLMKENDCKLSELLEKVLFLQHSNQKFRRTPSRGRSLPNSYVRLESKKSTHSGTTPTSTVKSVIHLPPPSDHLLEQKNHDNQHNCKFASDPRSPVIELFPPRTDHSPSFDDPASFSGKELEKVTQNEVPAEFAHKIRNVYELL